MESLALVTDFADRLRSQTQALQVLIIHDGEVNQVLETIPLPDLISVEYRTDIKMWELRFKIGVVKAEVANASLQTA